MTTIRIVTDIEVAEVPSDKVMESVAESVRHYADGVVTGQLLKSTDRAVRSNPHVHAADDYACDICRGLSTDGVK